MRSLVAFTVLVAVGLGMSSVRAQDLLIRSAKVHTVSSRGTVDSTDVLVRGGKIAAIGAGLAVPAGAEVVEAHNQSLTPGLWAGLSNLGITEVFAVQDTLDDTLSFGAPAWQQRWRPEFDVTRAFNPRSTLIPVSRIEGLTWTVLSPSSPDNVLGGQGAAVTLDGRYDAVLDGSRSLFVNWMGPGTSSGGSRAALYMLFEQAIREVRTKIAGEALLHPAGREVLAEYLSGGRIVFSVDRAADIHELIAFARRNNLKPVISGGAEAWMVANELARARVPVILNPLTDLPDSFNQLTARLDNAALLYQAGVQIAFTSEQTHNARMIRQAAGNAVAHGLPWEAALAAVTATPAEIFGMGATRGRIAVGQVADLVLWDGDPLEVTSAAARVWIAGRPIEMRSRQTQLRDRYFSRSSAQ
ncbi:MAG: amidohydrolase family protein [Proteobacteria bacterium]|nr:amidohydrolase family protein [Pseudomonadota bacterium]